MTRALRGIALLTMLMAAAPLFAAQHLMKVTQVYVGPDDDANAQYIMLQMYANGQNQVSGHSVNVYNATDAIVGTFTFSSSVANGSSQSEILLATAEAQSRFSISADLSMTAVLPAVGGKVCFDGFDCVSWGDYVGDNSDPSPSGSPVNSSGGIQSDSALRRDISAGNPAVLENSDDTNDSASDFTTESAAPRNNAGDVGTAPSDSGGGSGGGGNTGGGSNDGGSSGGGGMTVGLLPILLMLLLFRRRNAYRANRP